MSLADNENINKSNSEDGVSSLSDILQDRDQLSRAEKVLKAIQAGTAKTTGYSFLREAVKTLCEVFNMRYAFVSRLMADDNARAVAVYFNGEFCDGFDYVITGTPCQTLCYQDQHLCVTNDVQQLYPDGDILKKLEANCYLGNALVDSNNKTIGFISVFDTDPYVNDYLQNHIFDVLTFRTAAELSRIISEEFSGDNEQQLSSLFESAPDAIYMTDMDANLVRVNSLACDFTGYTSEELLKLKVMDIDASFPGMDAWDELCASVKNGEKVTFETCQIHKDGTHFPVEITCSQFNTSREAYMVGFARDISQRKNAEEQLKKREHEYRSLFENMLDGFALHEMIFNEKDEPVDYRFLDINPAFEKLTGLTREIVGKTVMEALPGTENYWVQFYAGVVLTGVPAYFENYSAELDRYYEVKAYRHAPGQFACFFADITERKKAQEQLEEKIKVLTAPLDESGEIAFHDLFDIKEIQKLQNEFADATGVASIITKTNGVPITEPSNFTHFCGEIVRKSKKGLANCIKSDSVIGSLHHGGPVIQPCLSGGLWDAGAAITVGGKHIANWLIGQVRDETQTEDKIREYAREIDVDEQVLVDAFNKVPSMSHEQFQAIADALYTFAQMLSTAAYQNVKQARAIAENSRLQKDRDRLMLAIEQAMEIVIITDTDSKIQYVNSAFEKITGYSREEVLGKNPAILNSGEHDGEFYKGMWKALHDGKTWSGRIINKKKDGTLFTEDALINPIIDNNGKVINYVAIKRDVTEELKLKDQLQQIQKLESIGRLAGGVAHDFNNLLMAIMGYVDLASEMVGQNHPIQDFLDEIIKASQRSADLTRQLLAFARKQTIIPKVINLNTQVTNTLKMLQRLIGEDVELLWQPVDDIWDTKFDPSQLDQVLANLCVNARDAIAGVGKITIETHNVVIDKTYNNSETDFYAGEYAQLTVSDNGEGMTRETLNKIFEPFFTTKEQGKGTGLGLSTVYGIIKQNGGFINVYSEPGNGTSFKLYFPKYTGTEEAYREYKNTQIPDKGTETILLVEDEAMLLELGQSMLTKLGYKVIATNLPEEAVKLAREYTEHIDVLMTDVIMPKMNGRDLSKEIVGLYPDIKIVFMSGYTANVIAHHGVLNKDVNFLQKPFTTKSLAAKLRDVLDNGS